MCMLPLFEHLHPQPESGAEKLKLKFNPMINNVVSEGKPNTRT